jgi:Ca2+-binding EF-hand superfamily protein
MAQERFNQTDTNRDGAITQEELKASFEKKKAERQQRPNKKGHAKHDKGKKHHKRGDFFAKIDANKDGKISRSEATKMADQRFARLDKNSDGAVTQEEMRAAHREMKKNRHHKKNEGKSGERQGTDRRQSAQCSPGVQGKKSAKSSSRKDDRGSEVARAERGARF